MFERPEQDAAETRTGVRSGDTLGAYRIEARLGAGGMGEVFRAVDTRLDRKVAVKISAVPFSERFEREARTLSSLNHPHICTLFDVGPNYLVMELIEGTTLAARITLGPLPIEEVTAYGAEIADALAEAHGVGIVHRDLKPQNIMVTRHGIKVLDFGIARVADEPVLTRTGAIIGTPAYMAPEQLAGREADARTDLFALGLVLYEMATGQLPVPGVSLAAMLLAGGATIPPASKIRRAKIPAQLDALIGTLLERDPARRPQSAKHVGERLRALEKRRSHAPRVVAVATALAVVAGAGLWWALGGTAETGPLQVTRLRQFTTAPGPKTDPAYSLDGASLAFVWRGESGNEPGIYVIRGQERPVRLTSAIGSDISPAWSPDGQQLAFLRINPGQANELMLVQAGGGVPQRQATQERTLRAVRQPEWVTRAIRPVLTWTPNGDAIVLPLEDADSGLASLFRVGIDGGPPRRLIKSSGGQGASSPVFSRDGRWLAYSDTEASGRQLYLVKMGPGEVADGERQPVPDSRFGHSPFLSPNGRRLMWASGTRLMEWAPGGATRAVYVGAVDIQALTAIWKTDAVPEVVFASASSRMELYEMQLKDGGRSAEGPPVTFLRLGGTQSSPALSPDGHWLAFSTVGYGGGSEVWIARTTGEDPRLLAPLPAGAPISWSADSRHLSFHSRRPSTAQAYTVDVDADGMASEPRQITDTAYDVFGPVFSPDKKYLYMSSTRDPNVLRIVRVPAAGGTLEDMFEGSSAGISVDGRRILYSKPRQRGLWERSLEGDVPSNPETRLVQDYVGPVGFTPAKHGVFYVGCDAAGQPSALRFFDDALRRSFDLAPPPKMARGAVPVLTLSPDERRLVFFAAAQFTPDLTVMELRRGQ